MSVVTTWWAQPLPELVEVDRGGIVTDAFHGAAHRQVHPGGQAVDEAELAQVGKLGTGRVVGHVLGRRPGCAPGHKGRIPACV